MIRNATDTQYETISWPRTSGDDPFLFVVSYQREQLAPHERG